MNQKRNSGFTLIELLAVIVILAIIALIAVPVIMNIINKANKSAFKDTAYGIVSAGELYFAERQLEPNGMLEDVTIQLPDTTKTLQLKGEVPTGTILITKEGKIAIAVQNGRYCVTKGIEDKDVTITEDIANCILPASITNITLKEENIILNKGEEKQIEVMFEPVDATTRTLNYVSSNTSVLTVDLNGKIKAIGKGTAKVIVTTTDGSNISKEIEVVVNTPIMTSDNTCIQSGNVCSDADILSGIKVNVKVNNRQAYDFYVISNTEKEVTLIMSENLGDDVSWINAEDYAKVNVEASCNYTSCVYGGPRTAVAELKTRTSGWTNIPEREYTYSDDSGGNKYTAFSEIMRARMLTYTEATDDLIGCTEYDKSCPKWLYSNLLNTGSDTDSLGNEKYGYWTSATKTVNGAWYVRYKGDISAGNFSVASENSAGIRPVITLTK